MQRWTPQHAKFVGRVIFANFLNLPLENYESIIEEVERLSIFKRLSRHSWDQKRNSPAIRTRHLSRAKTLNDEKKQRPSAVVAKIETRGNRARFKRFNVQGSRLGKAAKNTTTGNSKPGTLNHAGNRFTIRYAHEGFNKMYVIDNAVRDDLCADSNIRSVLFRLRRISSRNALTHALLKGIIEHQGAFLCSGDPTDLVPLSQVELTAWMNRGEGYGERLRLRDSYRLSLSVHRQNDTTHTSRMADRRKTKRAAQPINEERNTVISNSWVSRLVNRLSVITPSGEEKILKSFFPTQKALNKAFIKQILDKENEDIEARRLKKPLTDDQIRAELESRYRVRLSRHSVGHCRKDMGIPSAKRRLSGYKYPPLSANFSMLYPLTVESVQSNAPPTPGVYEFRLKGKEIEYPDGKTSVFYLGSATKLKKRLKEHLRANNKNSNISDFLRRFECFFRYIHFAKNWKEEEGRLYSLFVTTYGASPECNSVSPQRKQGRSENDKGERKDTKG